MLVETDEAMARFLSTPSVRRATFSRHCSFGQAFEFLSTPSVRRATFCAGSLQKGVRYFYPRHP